jgi:hypothetical protein
MHGTEMNKAVMKEGYDLPLSATLGSYRRDSHDSNGVGQLHNRTALKTASTPSLAVYRLVLTRLR